MSFVKPYLLGLAGSAYLFTIGWLRRRNRAAIVQLGHHFGYHHESRVARELPVVPVSALATEVGPLDIREMDAVDGNVSERELIAICRLTQSLQPTMLFEFGTFDGRTTLNLALNSAPGATVYTLDLPRTALSTAVAPIHRDEAQYADKPESGARYRGTEAEPRIIPLEGDSGSFDFTAYEGKIDFVFIDASHTFDYVINDSLEALRLIGSRAGTIVWHDYGRWDGVTAALHELKRKHDAFAGLRQIAGTTLAVVEVGNRQLQVRGPG